MNSMDRVIKKKKWTRQRITTILAIILFVAFLLYLWWSTGTSRLNVEKEKLSISTIQKGVFQEFISIDGSILPIKTYYLDVIEGGTVEKKFIEAGNFVKKGDTILKLANTTLQLDYMSRESQLLALINEKQVAKMTLQQNEINTLNSLADIEYQLSLAKRVYERNAKLVKKNMVSQEEFLQSKDNYLYQKRKRDLAKLDLHQDAGLRVERIGQLDMSIQRMRENLKLAKNTLNNLYIIAPIEGQLSTLKAEIGEAKSAGENVGQIDQNKTFKVSAKIDEHYISRIYEGLKGEFDFNNKTYKLEVNKIYPEVENGEFIVDLQFNNVKPKHIRRGQTLQIRLQLSNEIKAIRIPKGGFYQTTGGRWIFVINEAGTEATRRNIRLGSQNPEYYEVLEGLKPGEKVIISSYEGYENFDKLILK